MTPCTPVWRWGKNYTLCFMVQAVSLSLSPSNSFRVVIPPADPAASLATLSCTVKPSIPRKIKGDLYQACMIYSCCYFFCSRHRWKPIQLDWWRGKTNFCLAPHCEYSCSHRRSFPLPKVSVDPQCVLFEFLISALPVLTHFEVFKTWIQ